MEVEKLGSGQDFRLWPGGGENWDWRKTGTSHSPGIQLSDCEVLLENGSKVIVLGRGVFLRLKVPDETVASLEVRGVQVFVARTKKAIELYNTYVEKGEAVGGLFHSTC